MARPFRLQTLLELGGLRLDAAALELQRLRGVLQQAEAKLEQLREFQAEYEAALSKALVDGVEADRLQDFQRFLAKLGLAIQVQGGEVDRCRQAWTLQHRRWLDLRQREQALTALRDRHVEAEGLRERRRDQKEQDEFALKAKTDSAVDRR